MSKNLTKQTASQVLNALDSAGNELHRLKVAGFLDASEVDRMLLDIDTSADRIQIAAFGQEAFDAYKAKQAKVIKQDSDEPYMKTFENPQKPLKTDPDEPYMHKAPAGFQPGGVDTFDSDDTTQVTDRKEYAIRDLSEYADPTKKQPSWKGGPAGKSTKQGSAAAPRQAAAAPAKTWAP